MAFNKYYQDELNYLRQMGAEYARAYPETARFLAEGSSDPDVERMLEGFSFIAGRLRQKLDDELPELTHSLIETFWPHYLQPIPSMTIVQFQPARAGDKEFRRIPRGTSLDSAPVDGTRCRFHTAYDVVIPPMQITGVTLRSVAPASISVRFKLSEGLKASRLSVPRLRLHCAGTRSVASTLHACLIRHCTGVLAVSGDRSVSLDRNAVTAVGFAADETVLGSPGASFAGFGLLQEYFAFPEKFLFVDVDCLGVIEQLGEVGEFSLEFQLLQAPTDMPQMGPDHLLLGCTPAVNLFAHDADPIRVEPERVEYKVLPSGGSPEHFEVSSIESIAGLVQGQHEQKTYLPLYHQQRSGNSGGSYLVRRRPAMLGAGSDHHLTITGSVADETLSLRLMCTNRRLPHALGPGDLNHPTDQCPSGVRFRNLSKPTLPIVPPLNEDLEWRLLGHLSLNYRTLADVGSLRSLLDLYDLKAQVDQQARQAHRRLVEGLVSVSSTTATIISGGAPMRGVEVEVVLDDDHFDGEGEMHLFSSLLDELFVQYVGLNSFCRLVVRGSLSGDIHRRAPRIGRKRLL